MLEVDEKLEIIERIESVCKYFPLKDLEDAENRLKNSKMCYMKEQYRYCMLRQVLFEKYPDVYDYFLKWGYTDENGEIHQESRFQERLNYFEDLLFDWSKENRNKK